MWMFAADCWYTGPCVVSGVLGRVWSSGLKVVRGLAALCVVSLALLAVACAGSGRTFEERAQSIDRSLICPQCPGETIDQASVPLAIQMREIVREKLGEGWSRQQILQYFVDRFDEGVLAAPPKDGVNLVAWVVPPVTVAGAAVLLFMVLVAMRRGARPTPETPSLSEQELEPYLSKVDRELGLPPGGPQREPEEGPQETENRG